MKYVIGQDLGTTCIKALVFDETGRICAESSRDDALITPRKGWWEPRCPPSDASERGSHPRGGGRFRREGK